MEGNSWNMRDQHINFVQKIDISSNQHDNISFVD